jgi:hypothetical protein
MICLTFDVYSLQEFVTHNAKSTLLSKSLQSNGQEMSSPTRHYQTCHKHETQYYETTCSNKYKCKLNFCSNKYPCKKQYLAAECGCTKALSEEIDEWSDTDEDEEYNDDDSSDSEDNEGEESSDDDNSDTEEDDSNASMRQSSTCHKHATPFSLRKCSNQYKCKIGSCSNKYPCRKQYLYAGCGCIKALHSEGNPPKLLTNMKQMKNTVMMTTVTEEFYTYTSMVDTALQIQQKGSPISAELENVLTKDLLESQRHPDFPYVIAVEWYYDPINQQLGKGDIVFSNRPFPSSKYELLFTDKDMKRSSFKVLIIEVKGISGAHCRIKRRKVEQQLENSMHAWRKQRPNDDIWGCIYSNENTEWWTNMKRFEQNVQSQSDKLCIELVPLGVWSRNYKPSMPLKLWRILLEKYKEEADHRCEICEWRESSKSPERLILHQRWITKRGTKQNSVGSLIFLDFEVLCWKCHDCKHSEWSRLEGREAQMIRHFSEVNQYHDLSMAATMITFAKQKGLGESIGTTQWVVDSSKFDEIKEVKLWRSQHPYDVIKFGSLCLKRNPPYNDNPFI